PFDGKQQSDWSRQQAKRQKYSADEFKCAEYRRTQAVQKSPKLDLRPTVEQPVQTVRHDNCARAEADKCIRERRKWPIPRQRRYQFLRFRFVRHVFHLKTKHYTITPPDEPYSLKRGIHPMSEARIRTNLLIPFLLPARFTMLLKALRLILRNRCWLEHH